MIKIKAASYDDAVYILKEVYCVVRYEWVETLNDIFVFKIHDKDYRNL